MKYSKEERIEIGRKIHKSGVSNLKGAEMFGISEESARRYRILYENSQGISHNPSKTRKSQIDTTPLMLSGEPSCSSNDYASMSKDELIEELMKSRIREARLKKGYIVKGVGADKEFLPLDNKNTK